MSCSKTKAYPTSPPLHESTRGPEPLPLVRPKLLGRASLLRVAPDSVRRLQPVRRPGQASRLRHNPLLQDLASAYEASPYQIVLAWMLTRFPQLTPIPGATRPESIRDSAQAARLYLTPEDLAKLDAHDTPSPAQG
ncbi:aldo/keto reductase [Paenibacillus thiaminolyticus]|uniref:aldo/keto reductase n=1 Tax=Paenibacillus thiaminolyticus TaxID=49283 RepID=UPI0035A6FA12